MLFLYNPNNRNCVDHIDNNKLNNNLNNLRYATSQENGQNAKLSIKNASGTKGVCWNMKHKRWTEQIKINGKQIHLDFFVKKDDAINIRKQRAKDEFG